MAMPRDETPGSQTPDYLERLSARQLNYLDQQTLLRAVNMRRMLSGQDPVRSIDEALGGVGKVKQTEVPELKVDPTQMRGRAGPSGGQEAAFSGSGMGDVGGALGGLFGGRGRQQPQAPAAQPGAPAGPPGKMPATGGVPYRGGVSGDLQGVNPQFAQAMKEYAAIHTQQSGYSVNFISGYRQGDPRFHGSGNAIDIQLIDKSTGQPKAIPNYQTRDPAAWRAYQDYANGFKTYLDQKYPQLGQRMVWGGYFSGPPGKYGAADLMHFDLGGQRTLGGSWETGLTPQHAQQWGQQPGGGLTAWRQARPQGFGPRSPAVTTPPGPAPATTGGQAGVSDGLVNWVAQKEAFNPNAFNDHGVINIGYGTAARGRTSITEPEARAEMRAELQKHMDAVNRINPNLPQGAKDALTSLSYNTGGSWYQGPDRNPDGSATLLGHAKAGDIAGMKQRFVEYTKAGGQDVRGLANRRMEEVKMFDRPGQPAQPAQQAPQWPQPPAPRQMTPQPAVPHTTGAVPTTGAQQPPAPAPAAPPTAAQPQPAQPPATAPASLPAGLPRLAPDAGPATPAARPGLSATISLPMGMGPTIEVYGVPPAKVQQMVNQGGWGQFVTVKPAQGGAMTPGPHYELPGGGTVRIPGTDAAGHQKWMPQFQKMLPGVKVKASEAPLSEERLQQLAQSPEAQAYAQAGTTLPEERLPPPQANSPQAPQQTQPGVTPGQAKAIIGAVGAEAPKPGMLGQIGEAMQEGQSIPQSQVPQPGKEQNLQLPPVNVETTAPEVPMPRPRPPEVQVPQLTPPAPVQPEPTPPPWTPLPPANITPWAPIPGQQSLGTGNLSPIPWDVVAPWWGQPDFLNYGGVWGGYPGGALDNFNGLDAGGYGGEGFALPAFFGGGD